MKLLVISHNPISRHNAMGKTLRSFLSSMKKEEVCQLYIYPAYPCEDVCNSFYRVTDKDILKSLLGFGLPGGEVEGKDIGRDAPSFESRQEEILYSSSRKKTPLCRFARDILWSSAPWFNRKLKSWMERERPDCIFAAGGDAIFLYQIALRLSREYDLPIVAYLCDDFYFTASPKGAAGRLWHHLRKRKMEAFLNKATHAVVISPEMQSAYRRFPVPLTAILTGSSREIRRTIHAPKTISSLTYMGNLSFGRYRSLSAIGKALEQINRKNGTQIRLDVYSGQENQEAQTAFANILTIRFHGFLTSGEMEAVWSRAQLLVHVEDFDPCNADLVKHSISTKIADILASGIPLFAYGPKQTASMAYLQRNACAFTAVEENLLEKELVSALFNQRKRNTVAENALAAARKYHDRDINSQRLRRILERAVSERNTHEIVCR